MSRGALNWVRILACDEVERGVFAGDFGEMCDFEPESRGASRVARGVKLASNFGG